MKKIRYLMAALAFSFLLGAHNGYIALWMGEDPEPVRVFPYRISALPEADQHALERGIPISTQQELTKRLEDYLS